MKLQLTDWMPTEPDFELFHIYCHQKDYRLCFALNQQFGFNLSRRRDRFEILEKDNETDEEKRKRLSAITYPQLEFIDEVIHREIFVVSNQANPIAKEFATVVQGDLFSTDEQLPLLIPELQKVDFFLQIYGQISDAELNEIEDQLNVIPLINAAKRVDPCSHPAYLNLMH